MKSACLSCLFVSTFLGAALAAETSQPVTAQVPPVTAQVSPAVAQPVTPPTKQVSAPVAPAAQASHHGFGHTLLLYIPNRIFDVLDIVRARVRLGPGIAVGVRATKWTDIFLGSYASACVGLPGPRRTPRIPWPGGIESRSGLAASVADGTVTSYDSNPRYSATEVGLGAQAILIGAEIGVDPAEVFDLFLGIFTIDLLEDDL
jgi:hypothetical protein